jgi:uncharacterized membrane protein YdjX (TVP38/TMEM64 family)
VKKLLFDAIIIAASIILAIYLLEIGAVDTLVSLAGGNVLLVGLLAGIFFTSVLTTAPALVILSELAGEGNIILIALIGGLGAVIGDFVIFSFVRDRVAKDAGELLRGPNWRRFMRFMRRRHFMRLLPILGAIIIASPFPDEIGLALMGVTKMKTRTFVLISYSLNTVGIFIVLLVASAL